MELQIRSRFTDAIRIASAGENAISENHDRNVVETQFGQSPKIKRRFTRYFMRVISETRVAHF